MPRVTVKICGVTSPADAEQAVLAGADAIGLNFVPGSVRRVDDGRARDIVAAVAGRAEVIAVIADLDDAAIDGLLAATGIARVQLHGSEPPEQVARLGAGCIKAVRVGEEADLELAARYRGLLLVDAKVKGALGGTGARADWSLAARLAAERPIWLAGGLDAANVAEAIRAVSPSGVDVASGVESAPGVKDPEKLRAFVAAARGA